MTTALTTKQNNVPATLLNFGFDSQKVQLIKDSLCPKASDQELALFLMQCQRTGLDPFARQLYLIGRWDNRVGREVHNLQVSIDGARLVAQRSGEYAGQTAVYWCGDDGVWKDIWLSKDKPRAAKVGVYRKGFVEPLWAVALWDSYAQTKKDGSYTEMWNKFSSLMLGKVAEMLALRRSFPMELSGLYSTEEMSQADKQDSIPAEIVPQPAPTQAQEQPQSTTNNPTYTGTNTNMFWLADRLAEHGMQNDKSEEYKKAARDWHEWAKGKDYDSIVAKIQEVLNTK